MRNKGICARCNGIGACEHGGRPSAVGIRKRGRPVSRHDIDRLEIALISLRDCIRYTRNAGAHHAAARIRAALKSTQGAYNHARSIKAKQERAK